jgi:two-component system, OmpR family, response regulator
MRLLLIEDDAQLVFELVPELRRAGYAVEIARDGVDGEFLGNEEQFDVVVLDLGLPGRPGLDVLRNWRQRGNRTPVLILTARDSWRERVDGLQAGADDYLGKPFHTAELLARLEAVVRRYHGQADSCIEAGGIVLDGARQQARTRDGYVHDLTGIEFRLLRYLMMHPDRVLSKRELSDHIYEENDLRDSNVIEVYVNRLRTRFGRDLIETRRGQGYVLHATR